MSNILTFPGAAQIRNSQAVRQQSAGSALAHQSMPIQAPAQPSGYVPGIFFPVGEGPVTVGGHVAVGYKGIIRQDTGEVLGIHSSGYKLVKNEDVFPVFEEALRESGLDRTGMIVEDELAGGGARCHRVYRFPAHQAYVGNGDYVDLQLRVINSYDGSAAFSTLVGAFRLLCSNGMVIGDRYGESYGRHTRGLEPKHMIHSVQRTAELFLNETSKWRHWADCEITDQDAKEVFGKMPGMNSRLLGKLLLQWNKEKASLGNTMWALFNAATYWSTHEQVRRSSAGNKPSIIVEREARVRSMLHSKEFLKLAA